MAAYHRVYDFGHLQADCRGPGSAPELYARFEYGTTFTMTIIFVTNVTYIYITQFTSVITASARLSKDFVGQSLGLL